MIAPPFTIRERQLLARTAFAALAASCGATPAEANVLHRRLAALVHPADVTPGQLIATVTEALTALREEQP